MSQTLRLLGILCTLVAGPTTADISSSGGCLSTKYPQTRADFPGLLNCLGLVGEAVEVGVQAGVHASKFLQGWQGKRLRLVDLWGPSGEPSANQLFYVDIANIHGLDVRKQHRVQCEGRLSSALRSGRAEILELESTEAASHIGDGELDFVYLDARHDFMGVVADIRAWWPKVKLGGVFAGHDFVDGEFPEGDFFWISALRETLPDLQLQGHIHVTQEQNSYPSFFVLKTQEVAHLQPESVSSEALARSLYSASRYFKLWRGAKETEGHDFGTSCKTLCREDCRGRASRFTPTQTVGSTLRPFSCRGTSSSGDRSEKPDTCASEMLLDVQAYLTVCKERCEVTCQQREKLFTTFGAEFLSV